MRVYIAGPMRGLPGHNFAAFDKATTRWREAGHAVYNPAEADRRVGFDGSTEPPRGFVDAAICRDVVEIARADALAVLPGWEKSRMGAVEVALVCALDPPRPVYDAVTMKPLTGGALRFVWEAKPADTSILSEAYSLVHGARRQSYGHPREDYGRVAKMMTAILGVDVTPAKAILCMLAVKISRECHCPARDNRVDIAGYTECLDLVSREDA